MTPMTSADNSPPQETRNNEWFMTTHWSVVLAARTNSSSSEQALDRLCRAYWYPLYAYLRRLGEDVEAARDFTQAFFARLLEKNYLSQVQPEKGKFRCFLLASLKHFLADERDKARDQNPPSYAELGVALGLSEGGVKSAVSRMRSRYRELVREEVANTVSNPNE